MPYYPGADIGATKTHALIVDQTGRAPGFGESGPGNRLLDPAAQLDHFDYYRLTQVYNGVPAIQAKTRIVMEKASGSMLWTSDHDAQAEFSLVNAIYETVNKPKNHFSQRIIQNVK